MSWNCINHKKGQRKFGVCGDSECKNCFNNSCASDEQMKRCWDISKNTLQPYQVSRNCTKLIHFICDNGHSFETRPNHHTTGNHWCSDCSRGGTPFVTHPLSKYFSPNNIISINKLSTGSHDYIKIQCPTCKVDYERQTRNFVKNPNNICLCFPHIDEDEDKKEMFIQRMKRCWSSKNKDNFDDLSSGSSKKIHFDCEKCNHPFESQFKKVLEGSWCPYCSNQKLCDNNCDFCFQKSFASHPRSIFWSSENDFPARMVFKNSKHEYKYNCTKCNHVFAMCPKSINQKDRWCNICSGTKLCTKDDCKICFERSFASYQHKDVWSQKNEISPRNVFKSCAEKFLFICHKCNHEYEQRLDNKVCGKNGCPKCVNKTEAKLYDWLIARFPDVIKEAKFDWLKFNNSKFPCRIDFFIPSLNLAIELDGIQHYEQVSNWSSPEEVRKRDVFKLLQSLKHNITTIRLMQDEVFFDKNNWENVESYIKQYENPQIITLKNNKVFIFDNRCTPNIQIHI